MFIMKLCKFSMIRLIILIDFATTIIDNVQCEVQSDSYSYSDEVYSQLAAEYEQYQDDLPMPAGYKAAEAKLDNSASKSIADEYLSTAAQIDDISTEKREESYAEMASRLNCDNPWFWNTPKCTWIDVKSQNVIKRTKRNAKKAAWIFGSLFALAFLWLCLSYSLYWYKMRKRKHLDNLRKKYLPGRIELPNGKIGIYEPTAEEEDAYEDLIKVLIVQEVIARS